MDHETTNPRRGRETALTLMLVLVLGGTIVFFLNLITFGLMTYVLLAVLIMGVVASLHYLLWGQALTQETAGEREEMEIKEKLEMPEDREDEYRYRRY